MNPHSTSGRDSYLNGLPFAVTRPFRDLDHLIGAFDDDLPDEALHKTYSDIVIPSLDKEQKVVAETVSRRNAKTKQSSGAPAKGSQEALVSDRNAISASEPAGAESVPLPSNIGSTQVQSTISYPMWLINSNSGTTHNPAGLDTQNTSLLGKGGTPPEKQPPSLGETEGKRCATSGNQERVPPTAPRDDDQVGQPVLNGEAPVSAHPSVIQPAQLPQLRQEAQTSRATSGIQQTEPNRTVATMLKPVPIQKGPPKLASGVPSGIKIADFADHENSSPFDAVALTSLNDMEELRSVLERTTVPNGYKHESPSPQLLRH